MHAIHRKKNKRRIIVSKKIGEKMMKLLYTLILLTTMQIGSYINVFADEIKITASVDKTRLELGDCIRYRIKVYGTLDEVQPRLPELNDFSLRFGPVITIGTEVEEDGVSVFRSYTFGLAPLRMGKFTIPPSKLWYKKKKYETDSFDVEVIDRTPFNIEND